MSSYSLLTRKLLKNKGDSLAFAFWLNVFSTVLLGILSFGEKEKIALGPRGWGLVLVSSLVFAVTALMFTRARKLIEASVISVFSRTNSFWALLLGVLVLGERVTIFKVLGIGLIVSGLLLVILKKRKFVLPKGAWLVLVANFIYTSGSILDKYMVNNLVPTVKYYFLVLFLSLGWMLLFIPNRLSRIKKEIKLQKWGLVVAGLLIGLYSFFSIQSLYWGEISKVASVRGLSVLLTVWAGVVFLKERDGLLKKMIAAVLCVVGVYFLSLS